ncbi:MAG: VWA domain-containing protein [Candidatus Eremiobacteraeota bacterium]|nr:VWA domain-containing protein [Candidatus Eremiobacteraeota bacterium]
MFDQLARNTLIFVRALHRFGLPAQPDRCILFMQALARLGFRSRADVKAAGRSIFVRGPEQLQVFDAAFDAYWTNLAMQQPQPSASEKMRDGKPADGKPGDGQAATLPQDLAPPATARAEPSLPEASKNGGPEARLVAGGDRSFTYSFAEALSQRDFSQLLPDEAEIARRLTKKERLALGARASRRTLAGRRGGEFDARRSLRASLRQYGELVALPTREPKTKQRDLVLLCDISGSMDRYARLLLQFMHAMRHTLGKVEAFAFGTRLTRITRQIRHRDIESALSEISASIPDWGGGTRIGECLHEFNRRWARRVLAHGAIVIIISDGWDRGDIQLLADEMRSLQRRSYRLIWLNPLLGAKNYRPQTVGMKAALPYIDDFLPAHNLKSLAQLIVALRSVDRRRAARPQMITPLAQGIG